MSAKVWIEAKVKDNKASKTQSIRALLTTIDLDSLILVDTTRKDQMIDLYLAESTLRRS